MRDHAKLSPSSAARWLTCTASVALEKGFPEKKSEYAAEGTYAHALCELEGLYATGRIDKRALSRRKKRIFDKRYHSAEAEEAAADYATYIKETAVRCAEPPVICFEQKLDLGEWVPGGFGTADCVILAGDTIHVIDFKYGKGVEVSADNNPQMMLYAAGAWSAFALLYEIDALEKCEEEVENMRKEFLKRRDFMYERLNKIPGMQCPKPEGAFYLMPDVTYYFGKSYKDWKIESAADLCNYLLEEARVAVVPGNAFEAPKTIRFAYSVSIETIAAGMDRMEEALKKLS